MFVGIGVGVARHLGIPGEELDGVVDAIKFIYDIRTKDYSEIPVGDRVAVIGMGMTAIDAATQSKRFGAKEVVMVYRRDELEKILHRYRIRHCQTGWLLVCVGLLRQKRFSANRQSQSVSMRRCSFGRRSDASGKRAIVPTGEMITIEADMIIRAAGQIPLRSSSRPRKSRTIRAEFLQTVSKHKPQRCICGRRLCERWQRSRRCCATWKRCCQGNIEYLHSK